MKYSVIQCVNGNNKIVAENIEDLSFAKVKFHGLCQTLWNSADVLTAEVMIADEQLNCVEGYREFIHHDPEPEPEPESESEPETEGTEGTSEETDSAAEEVPAE